MKLHEHASARMNLIGRYGPDGITVNARHYAGPLMVAPGFLLTDWVADVQALEPAALAPLWPLEARVVLLGGRGFLPDTLRSLRRVLAEREIGLEVMDLGAACRTYNVLAQEDRAAAALLFPA